MGAAAVGVAAAVGAAAAVEGAAVGAAAVGVAAVEAGMKRLGKALVAEMNIALVFAFAFAVQGVGAASCVGGSQHILHSAGASSGYCRGGHDVSHFAAMAAAAG